MKKGFTLVELLVALLFTVTLGVWVYTFVFSTHSGNSADVDYSFINPQLETARSQRRMAEEMQRQNDLLQQRLELLERESTKKEH